MQAAGIEWETQGAAGILRLSGVVDIFEAESLRATAAEAARAMTSADTGEAGEPILLDLGGVERLDTSAAQILCAFGRALNAGGRTLRLLPLPENVAQSLATLGVTL